MELKNKKTNKTIFNLHTRINVQTFFFVAVQICTPTQRQGRWKQQEQPETSALSIPAPDGGVIAHRYQNAAVAAEAGLPDGRCAFGEGQRGAPEEEQR